MDSNQQKGSDVARMIWIVGSPIIFAVGVFGNLMTIFVLTSKRVKTTSTTIFLTFIAVADLFMVTIMLPRWWLIYLFGFDIRHIHNIVCKVQFFANYFCGAYSSCLLAALTIERTICTVKPHRVKTICTLQVAVIVSIALALTLFAVHGHVLIGIKLSDVVIVETSTARKKIIPHNLTVWLTNTSCESILHQIPDIEIDYIDDLMLETLCNISFNPDIDNLATIHESTEDRKIKVCWYDDINYGQYFSGIHQIMATVSYIIIPATIFFAGFIIIIKSLHESKKWRKRMGTEFMRTKRASDNHATQITVTLLFVNIVFIITTTPALIYLMGRSTWVDEDLGMTEEQEIIWAIVNLMVYINHSINFILYFLSGQRFRRTVLETFRCTKSPIDERGTGVSFNNVGISSVSSSYDLSLK
jgi:hypothetical protein